MRLTSRHPRDLAAGSAPRRERRIGKTAFMAAIFVCMATNRAAYPQERDVAERLDEYRIPVAIIAADDEEKFDEEYFDAVETNIRGVPSNIEVVEKVLNHERTKELFSALGRLKSEGLGYPALGIYGAQGEVINADLAQRRMRLQRYLVPVLVYALNKSIAEKKPDDFSAYWKVMVRLTSGKVSPVAYGQGEALEVLGKAMRAGVFAPNTISDAVAEIKPAIFNAFREGVVVEYENEGKAYTEVNVMLLTRIVEFVRLAAMAARNGQDACDFVKETLRKEIGKSLDYTVACSVVKGDVHVRLAVEEPQKTTIVRPAHPAS